MRPLFLLLSLLAIATGDESYKKPPQPILDVLNAPETPRAFVSPSYTHVLLAEPLRYPPIADVAAPMLRIAGVRINPRNNGPHRAPLFTSLVLKRVDDGAETRIALPAGAQISIPKWSPDGKQFAFAVSSSTLLELWIGSVSSGRAHKQEGLHLNAALGFNEAFRWLSGEKLLVTTVPAGRGNPPAEAAIPTGPHAQESLGHSGPIRTYEDMLTSAHDEDLFDYYATAQLTFIDTASGRTQAYGKPGLFEQISPAPDGRHALSGSADATLRLWDVEKGAASQCFEGHSQGVTGLAFTPDGQRIVSGSADATLRCWDVGSGAQVHCFTGHTAAVKCVALSPTGRRALSGSVDRTVRLWRLPP